MTAQNRILDRYRDTQEKWDQEIVKCTQKIQRNPSDSVLNQPNFYRTMREKKEILENIKDLGTKYRSNVYWYENLRSYPNKRAEKEKYKREYNNFQPFLKEFKDGWILKNFDKNQVEIIRKPGQISQIEQKASIEKGRAQSCSRLLEVQEKVLRNNERKVGLLVPPNNAEGISDLFVNFFQKIQGRNKFQIESSQIIEASDEKTLFKTIQAPQKTEKQQKQESPTTEENQLNEQEIIDLNYSKDCMRTFYYTSRSNFLEYAQQIKKTEN